MSQPVALFAGDAHLKDGQPENWSDFFSFLRGPARRGERLYLLGDLFESWVGDDDRQELGEQMRCELRAVAETGVAVFVIPGNHDFMIGRNFCIQAGAEFCGLRKLVTLAGKRLLLMHGDALDSRYRRRRVWADPATRRMLAEQPIEARLALAAKYADAGRGASEPPRIDERRAARLIKRLRLQAIVHGHTHQPGIESCAGGQRAVIPAWPAAGGRGGWISIDERGQLALCSPS